MANVTQLNILKLGKFAWNEWRKIHPDIRIDLSEAQLPGANLEKANLTGAILTKAYLHRAHLFGADVQGADFSDADLRQANFMWTDLRDGNFTGSDLSGAYMNSADLSQVSLRSTKLSGAFLSEAVLTQADLRGADLTSATLLKADLSGADLREANLFNTYLTKADLTGANLEGANLSGANLSRANLTGANLTGAVLEGTILVETNLEQATLTNCNVYGLSAWSLQGSPKEQSNLIITPSNEPTITVDNLQVAQFVYLLLNRSNVRNVIDTITSKAVLVLGRFTPERKAVLDAIADELRKYNLLPIIFDFDRPTSRDFTETIKILAGMSLFVIADITNPKSSPLELQATVPDYQIPFVPIIQQGERAFSMFSDLLGKYDWVLPLIEYSSIEKLRLGFKPAIIERSWQKQQELQQRKTDIIKTQSIDEFLTEHNDSVEQ